MKKLSVLFLFFLPQAVFSNPVPAYIINEFQVAPDSLERIELVWPGVPGTSLEGYMVVTSAGTAYVDSGVYPNTLHLVVLSDSNTTGIFSLDDTEDSIVICDSSGPLGEWFYYRPSNYNGGEVYPTPPPGASSSRIEIWVCGEHVNDDWYIDPTPTFGLPNDGYPDGCRISGMVFDEDSLPIGGIEICAGYTCGSYYTYYSTISANDGRYSFNNIVSQGYKIYVVSNTYWAETLYACPYAMSPVESLNFYLKKIGIEEEEKSVLTDFELSISPNPFTKKTVIRYSLKGTQGTPKLAIYDLSGRLVHEFTIHGSYGSTSEGRNNEVSWTPIDKNGNRLPKGIYFCRLKTTASTLTKKLILL